MAVDPGRDPVASLLGALAAGVEQTVAPPEVGFVVDRARRVERRRLHRQRLALAAAVVVLAAAALVSVATLGHRHRVGSGPFAALPSHVVRFGEVRFVVKDLPLVARDTASVPASGVTTLHLPVVSPDHADIAFGAGRVWVLEHGAPASSTACGRLVALDATTAQVVGSVPIGLCPNALAYGAGSVWVLASQIGVAGYQLLRVDPATLHISSTTVIDGGPHGIAPQGDTGVKDQFVTVSDGHVVIAVRKPTGAAQLSVLDPRTGTVTRSVILTRPDGPVTGLGATGGTVWVGTANGWVMAFDPRKGALSRARRLGTRVVSLSAAGPELWVTLNLPVPPNARYPGLDLVRLDPTTGGIAQDTGLPIAFVATDGTSVWALGSAPPYRSDGGLVAELDLRSGTLRARTQLPAFGYDLPDTLGVSDGAAWVLNDTAGTLTRIRPDTSGNGA
ncbi:PQQ-binding-like beta-propeller repeat protein [Aciditerrimonas ferrireducens]|uniref:PQQ-binding-like beta-propeller repeat protein n=1 Tax=Aciditerrimonas ferrireducens TaxID=667306 RepID=A0ABV6C4K4_9ACTN